MPDRNVFRFDGKLVEKSGNTETTVLNQDNVTAGEGIAATKSGDNVEIALNIGVSVVNGMLCTTFEEETEEV